MPLSYYGAQNPQSDQGASLPVLRMPMTPPVRVALPAARPSGGGGGVGQAIDMDKIAALLKQKWGASAGAGGGDPDPDQPYLDAAAALDGASAPQATLIDPDPDFLYLQGIGGGK